MKTENSFSFAQRNIPPFTTRKRQTKTHSSNTTYQRSLCLFRNCHNCTQLVLTTTHTSAQSIPLPQIRKDVFLSLLNHFSSGSFFKKTMMQVLSYSHFSIRNRTEITTKVYIQALAFCYYQTEPKHLCLTTYVIPTDASNSRFKLA